VSGALQPERQIGLQGSFILIGIYLYINARLVAHPSSQKVLILKSSIQVCSVSGPFFFASFLFGQAKRNEENKREKNVMKDLA
jgi:hypothetical protein